MITLSRTSFITHVQNAFALHNILVLWVMKTMLFQVIASDSWGKRHFGFIFLLISLKELGHWFEPHKV